jgi:hypothetical protein
MPDFYNRIDLERPSSNPLNYLGDGEQRRRDGGAEHYS